MKSRKQKSLYLGGGFRDHQILYMIPIIIGTCKRYKIKKIKIEKKLNPRVQNLDIIKKKLKGNKIIYENDLYFKESVFSRLPILFLFILLFFFKSFFAKKSLLNKENDWFNCQINHCLWDTGIRNNKDSLEKIEIRSRIKSSLLIAQKYLKTKKLLRLKLRLPLFSTLFINIELL